MIEVLNIKLHGKQIGTISLLPHERSLFVFDESYIEDQNRFTLSQSFYSQSGELLTDSRPVQTKLTSFFSNLLPEGYLRQYLADRGGVNSHREFQLLRLLGKDLAGAVTVGSASIESTSDASQATAVSMTAATDVLRFSLAGVQLKFSAMMSAQKGLTIPANGMGGDWIVKLPSPQFQAVPENEWAMLNLARDIGISVPETKLILVEDIAGLPDIPIAQSSKYALVIKRFDRSNDGSRIHIEDLAQVYGLFPEKKYQKVSYGNIAKMLWELMGEQGLTDFIRRLTFNILIGNGDMHLKNWSLIYPDKLTPQLAPAYDYVSTIPYLPHDKLALTLMGNREMTEIKMDHFIKMAYKFQLPQHLIKSTVQQTTEKTKDVWRVNKNNVDLSKNTLEKIDAHMQKVSF